MIDFQTIITIASVLLNIREIHGWFKRQSLAQKASIVWHCYSTATILLLVALWFTIRYDGMRALLHANTGNMNDSLNSNNNNVKNTSDNLSSVVIRRHAAFFQWTTGIYSYLFFGLLGIQVLLQFPLNFVSDKADILYLVICYLLTLATHFPFIGCILYELNWSYLTILIIAFPIIILLGTVYVISELTFRLQSSASICKYTEIIAVIRFCEEWFYLMLMVLPFLSWGLELPDFFIIGYAFRVCLWMTYIIAICKASTNVRSPEWLQWHQVIAPYKELKQIDDNHCSDDSEEDDDEDDDDDSDKASDSGDDKNNKNKIKHVTIKNTSNNNNNKNNNNNTSSSDHVTLSLSSHSHHHKKSRRSKKSNSLIQPPPDESQPQS